MILILCAFPVGMDAQVVPVDQGSYTLTFPGVDAAGRNSFPQGTPQISGNAVGKPIPTNDWWSAKLNNNHVSNLFSYPYTLKTVNEGLVVSYIPWGPIDAFLPITVGVTGLNASQATISDYSDWTVSLNWQNGAHEFEATAGIGMPFLYFEKASTDVAEIIISEGTAVIAGDRILVTDARNGADFIIFGPAGTVWTQNGTTYTSSLNNKDYWSMAFVPPGASDLTTIANEYQKYAFVFPTNTSVAWDYDEATGIVRTDFEVETEIKEGTDTTVLQGLLPHQWGNLAANSPTPNEHPYTTVRGELKTLNGNRFSVENTFYGILPTLPYLNQYSEGFSPSRLNQQINSIKNDQLATWTDSYNEGQVMNRLIQTARIAEMTGDTAAMYTMAETVKERLEDWLSVEANEVAFLFYYNQTWTAMIGYPAGHGQDGNLNDHHFHWGYFIHAASFVEQLYPGWMDQWGDMIDLLVRDASSPDRNDPLFPFLRNFSPFAGHCWANGFASFPQGNDQESTSESMQFNSSLIHWGSISGNDSIRDLGIYLYTTEQSAVEEYWFDMNDRVFGPTQQYGLVSRVWGNSYDNGTFWTADIAASYGIEMYPIHGGSLYLGQDSTYVAQIWNELTQYTGILNNEVNPNLWHDVKWKYLSFIDPALAISMYDSYPDRNLKFGISDAHTYHWLHAMNALGRVDISVTADHPLAVAFKDDTLRTYVAHNYSSNPITVTYSNGFQLQVPPHKLVTSRDIGISGSLTTDFTSAYPGGSVNLSLEVANGTPTKVEFMAGEQKIGEALQAPFELKATNLQVGSQQFFAKIYEGEAFNLSNFVEITVGEQLSYFGEPIVIPGDIEAGHYDTFEGGKGQGIAYSDLSPGNNGDFRPEEDVDATFVSAEGATVGWIAAGEWLEYTVDVQQPGLYDLAYRYACGNQSGGGPFQIESDGQVLESNITVSYTGDWDVWSTRTVTGIPLKSGKQVLRLFFTHGELNLGKMSFTYQSALPYDQPVADAGSNLLIQLPATSGSLDASGSSDPGNSPLTYEWTQVYGPSVLTISDSSVAQPSISGLEEGVYLMTLTVSNGSYGDTDEVYVISSQDSNVAPKVSILTPREDFSSIENETVTITAYASDLIGQVNVVEFFADSTLIGFDLSAPYEVNWTPAQGSYELTARATDNQSAEGYSQIITATIEEAPSCEGTSFNGDFSWRFSDDKNDPTLTFIPSIPGMGSPTCILYYGTDSGNMPGYGVTPNVPFKLNADQGQTVYFYYTYSYPGQGERNNSANKDSYVVGTCVDNATSIGNGFEKLNVNLFPNPTSGELTLDLPFGENQIRLFSVEGKQLQALSSRETSVQMDLSKLPQGIYLLEVINGNRRNVSKVIRE